MARRPKWKTLPNDDYDLDLSDIMEWLGNLVDASPNASNNSTLTDFVYNSEENFLAEDWEVVE